MGLNVFLANCSRLLAETEGLDDGAVAVDVNLVQIIEQGATLTNELCQRTGGHKVLVMLLHVLGKVCDTIGKQRNLALCRTGVGS